MDVVKGTGGFAGKIKGMDNIWHYDNDIIFFTVYDLVLDFHAAGSRGQLIYFYAFVDVLCKSIIIFSELFYSADNSLVG